MSPRPARHQARAKFCGTLTLLCPVCGYTGRYRLGLSTWRIRCKGVNCRKRFVVSVALYTLPVRAGVAVLPPADFALPVVPVDAYVSGQATVLVRELAPA